MLSLKVGKGVTNVEPNTSSHEKESTVINIIVN